MKIDLSNFLKETSQAQLKATFFDHLNFIIENLCFGTGGIGQPSLKGLYRKIKTIAQFPKRRKPRFQKIQKRFLYQLRVVVYSQLMRHNTARP